jgi:hypothetical protein
VFVLALARKVVVAQLIAVEALALDFRRVQLNARVRAGRKVVAQLRFRAVSAVRFEHHVLGARAHEAISVGRIVAEELAFGKVITELLAAPSGFVRVVSALLDAIAQIVHGNALFVGLAKVIWRLAV